MYFHKKSSSIACVLCETPFNQDELQPNGICPRCVSKLPKKITSKYNLWSHIPPLSIFALGLVALSYAAYSMDDWMVLPWPGFLRWEYMQSVYLGILVWVICTIIAFYFPNLARIKFQTWIVQEKNLEQIESALKNIKTPNVNQITSQIGDHAELKKKKMIFWTILSLIFNGSMIFIRLISKNNLPASSHFWQDFISIMWILSSLLTLFQVVHPNIPSSIGFWHQGWRIFLFSLGLLGFFLIFAGKIYLIPSLSGFFYADLEWSTFISNFWDLTIYIQCGILILLDIDLLLSKIVVKSTNSEIREESRLQKLIYSLIEKLILTPSMPIVILLFAIITIAGFILVMGDYFMFLSFFSVDIVVGIIFPVALWLLLILKFKHRNTQHPYPNANLSRLSKFVLVFSIINLSPILLVPIYTTPSLDRQFSTMFGPHWETQIESEFESPRSLRYSLYDNLFSFETNATAQFNIPYMKDYPPRVEGNTSIIEHTFYFDAYLPPQLQFGSEHYSQNISLPVVIMLHGEVEDKGAWNANMTSQYLARKGFLVCDLNYGYLRTNNNGLNYTGYYLRDQLRQIGQCLNYIHNNSEFLHADLSKVFFAGRHLGGGLALLCGMGYNDTLSPYFPSGMFVKGIIPFYPVSNIGTDQTFFKDTVLYYGSTLINGSSDSANPDYNPDWDLLNPLLMLKNSTDLIAPLFFITGSHDWLITIKYSQPFLSLVREKAVPLIYAEYLLGNDGFDGLHSSPYGQNVLFYLERFLLLSQ